ncbi:hypothetical protein CCM_06437 [Cordyceps militaris CM01]|uniref:Uncharacterized protein n=1 Tax=Cordyceps militaris (strain CM01) TaxID=983644 RepID=G3JMC9_CORMM|nr:uncharacterized protein CCM_06437 [Cordyceps militaris CM01]EGX90017.1 hypothetical protein CCM_06437 [Cordyceps militaris CM01]
MAGLGINALPMRSEAEPCFQAVTSRQRGPRPGSESKAIGVAVLLPLVGRNMTRSGIRCAVKQVLKKPTSMIVAAAENAAGVTRGSSLADRHSRIVTAAVTPWMEYSLMKLAHILKKKSG